MIITLTANPSHDRTVALADTLQRGAVQRAASVISQAGGKGVNISRAAVAAGARTLAVIPAGTDDPFVLELHAAGIPCEAVPTSGPPRVNLTISEPDGTTTKLNSPGPHLDAEAAGRLRDVLVARAAEASWVVLAGSLPPGAPTAGTPSSPRPCAAPRPASPSTPARLRCGPWSTPSVSRPVPVGPRPPAPT